MSQNDSNKDKTPDPDATANLRKPKPCNSLEEALSLVAQERMRQDAKWGSDVERILSIPAPGISQLSAAQRCGILSSRLASKIEQKLRVSGQENYVSIVYEELCESCEAAEMDAYGDNEDNTLEEVTQLAASAVKWMEALIRRRQARIERRNRG